MKYGVIHQISVTTPGDERSRTHPGHGYPESTDYYDVLKQFETLDELKAWVKQNQHTSFKAVQFEPLTIETEIVVKVGGK